MHGMNIKVKLLITFKEISVTVGNTVLEGNGQ